MGHPLLGFMPMIAALSSGFFFFQAQFFSHRPNLILLWATLCLGIVIRETSEIKHVYLFVFQCNLLQPHHESVVQF